MRRWRRVKRRCGEGAGLIEDHLGQPCPQTQRKPRTVCRSRAAADDKPPLTLQSFFVPKHKRKAEAMA